MSLEVSKKDLTIFVPTRGRPKALRQFAGEFYATITGDSQVIFVVDEDDPELPFYIKDNNNDFHIWVAPKSARGMVAALNYASNHFLQNGSLGYAIGFMGDDHRPRTVGWDSAYLSVLRGLSTGFVYGNDLLQGELMPTQVAFTTDILKALGYMSPPSFNHLCVDLVWKLWGEGIDKIQYLDDVVVEHMHPLAGKARADKNYKIVNSNVIAKADNAAYHDYLSYGLQEDIGRIKMMMENGYCEPR